MNNYQQKKYDLCLVFEESTFGKKTFVNCCLNDKISDLIKADRIKSGDNNENLRFIYNAKILNFGSTVGESGLSQGAKITVSSYGNLN